MFVDMYYCKIIGGEEVHIIINFITCHTQKNMDGLEFCKCVELGLCPQQIPGPQFHIEYINLFEILSNQEVGKSNILQPQRIMLLFQVFFA